MSRRVQEYLANGCDTVPHPLAETLDHSIALAAMNRFSAATASEGKYHSAWYHMEFSMHQSDHIPQDVRESYLDTTQGLLGDIVADSYAHHSTKFGALILSSYVHVLAKRARGEEITSDECEQIYHSLGSAIAYMQPLSQEEPPPSIMVETALMALSARNRRPEFLLYPTSPREESSKLAPWNHDNYFIENGRKLPIQQKLRLTEKEYDQAITVVTLEPIIDKALAKYNLATPRQLSEKINYVLSLIVLDTQNPKLLERSEHAVLNHLGECVARLRSIALEAA